MRPGHSMLWIGYLVLDGLLIKSNLVYVKLLISSSSLNIVIYILHFQKIYNVNFDFDIVLKGKQY